VINHKGYELTTLRQDITTDGRRATVSFTDDWQADAARRDFTFNAIYVDSTGKIYDYFDGTTDLKSGQVRFIGKADERIREDVLRILRFFRFHAWFGKGEPDTDGLAACRDLAFLLPQLSVERVWREISKLLAADYPLASWALMEDNYVLTQILPEADNRARLALLLDAEKKFDVAPNSLVRLAALLPKDVVGVTHVAKRLKLSNRETETLQILATLPDKLKGKLDPVPFRRMLYTYGADAAHDAALLLIAEDRSADFGSVLASIRVWDKPLFPIQGADILKLGIPAGPKVGIMLRTIEEWWVLHDFRPTRDECLAEITRQLQT
jgi:poly(A) polymerase